MAGALGLSPWTGDEPISLWERKLGQVDDRTESFRMKLGSMIEPVIGKLAAEALPNYLGAKVKLVAGKGPIRHAEYPFLASNPDFVIALGMPDGFSGLVQAKLHLDGPEFGEPDDAGIGEGIPLHYRIQGWGELLTTGSDIVYFAVLNPRDGVTIYPLSRHAGDNEQAIMDLEFDVVEWWREYVEKKVAPPPSGGSADALARRFPEVNSTKLGKIASAGQEATLLELLEAVKAKDEALERWEELKNVTKAMIGEAAFIEGAGKRFSWGNTKRTNIAWKEIAAGYRRILDGVMGLDLRSTPAIEYETSPGGRVAEASAEDLDALVEVNTTKTANRGPFTIGEMR